MHFSICTYQITLPRAVLCEDEVLIFIGEFNQTGVDGTVGEVCIKSLEEDMGSAGGGGNDDMMLAHFEVHDGAILPGKTGQRIMWVSTEQRKASDYRVARWAGREDA